MALETREGPNTSRQSRASHGDNLPPSRGRDFSPSVEKHVHIVLAMEAREGPNTQDKVECVTTASGHLFENVMATLEIDSVGFDSIRFGSLLFVPMQF